MDNITISLEEYREFVKNSERLQIAKEYILKRALVSRDEIAPILGIEIVREEKAGEE